MADAVQLASAERVARERAGAARCYIDSGVEKLAGNPSEAAAEFKKAQFLLESARRRAVEAAG